MLVYKKTIAPLFEDTVWPFISRVHNICFVRGGHKNAKVYINMSLSSLLYTNTAIVRKIQSAIPLPSKVTREKLNHRY